MTQYVYINVWPNQSIYSDGGWKGIFGPFSSLIAAEEWCKELGLNPDWIEELTPIDIKPETD